MSKPFSHLLQHRLRRKKGDTRQLAAHLAPLEERERHEQIHASGNAGQSGAIQEPGAIIVRNQTLPLSKDIIDARTDGLFLGLEPVVLFIVGLMLAFILFIAWQISRMPAGD